MIKSWHSLIIYIIVLTGAFVYTSFFPTAPFQAFSIALSGVETAYITRRYFKHKLNGKVE